MHLKLFNKNLNDLLKNIYPERKDLNKLSEDIANIVNSFKDSSHMGKQKKWDNKDVFLITYSDSIIDSKEKPLKTLYDFLKRYTESINSVHILPFMPSSSDSGFSVIDYKALDQNFGSWEDLDHLTKKYNVMIDIVLNHVSKSSKWFENFKKGKGTGSDYFIEVDNWQGKAQIVRPRTSELFQKISTDSGLKSVWCTFSHDQIDLNFKNPAVLIEFVEIFLFYLKKNIHFFRLDAIAYIWKEVNTGCINRPQTHYIVKFLRLILDHLSKNSVIITETNIPNKENLIYFGDRDEAHWIYNFTLAPLILYTLLYGNSKKLRRWSMTMPPAKNGNSYFNFLASHDGIGLRPLEGYVDDEELINMINRMEEFGGKTSYRISQWGDKVPYEMNISFLDSMTGTIDNIDNYKVDRFNCAHAIMLSFEGVPAIYIHSLIGTNNNYDSLNGATNYRSINRYQWNKKKLYNLLNDSETQNHLILNRLNDLLSIRSKQKAFHPNATQFTLDLGDKIFGIWRQDYNRSQSIFCIFNISNEKQILELSSINLIDGENWYDLISNKTIKSINGKISLKSYQYMWITNL